MEKIIGTYTVLCVSAGTLRYVRQTGEAKIVEMGGKVIVRFNGFEFPFKKLDTGLDGTAVCLSVGEGQHGWQLLYTDTPTQGHTAEVVRKKAEAEISAALFR